jgi:hypothetical protein
MARLGRDNDPLRVNLVRCLAAIFFRAESVFQSWVSPNLVSIR